MTLNAVNGYQAANKRCLPSRLIRGRAKSYQQDLDQRIQKLPRPVQSELNLLLGDRESATCNRFHRRDWTVVMMREEYSYKFATVEHEEVKKNKRFWKKGDKRPIHYLFILRGEDGKVATDDKGMHTATRHGNPWKRVDEKERREKWRERNTRRYGKGYIDNIRTGDRHHNNFNAPPFSSPRPPPLSRGSAPDLASCGVRLAREDLENFAPGNPFSFRPPRCGNGVALPFPQPPPPPPPPFPSAPPPGYGHSCLCRNAAFYPPPPPPPLPPVWYLSGSPRPRSPLNNPHDMFSRANLPPANPTFPRPAPSFPMPTPPPPPPFPLREFWNPPPPATAAATGCPAGQSNLFRMRTDPDRFTTNSVLPFPSIPTEYTGSSIGSLPSAPRLSNLTTPTTFSRVTSNHTGSSADHTAQTSTPASPLPEEYDEDDEYMSEDGSSRSASPFPRSRDVRSRSPSIDA